VPSIQTFLRVSSSLPSAPASDPFRPFNRLNVPYAIVIYSTMRFWVDKSRGGGVNMQTRGEIIFEVSLRGRKFVFAL